MKESSLTKTTTQGIALGIAGAAAMFAIEILMLPALLDASDAQLAATAQPAECVRVASATAP